MPVESTDSTHGTAFARATAADAHFIADLRRRREEWMQANGITQWQLGSLPLPMVEEQVAAGEWWVLREPPGAAGEHGADTGGDSSDSGWGSADSGWGSEILAAGRLLDSDPAYWGEHPDADAPALYVHALMTAEAAAGRGLARIFLDEACAEAARRGVQWQRLDCRDHLLRIYEPMGFERVGQKTFTAGQTGFSGFSGYTVTLMQRPARARE